MQPVYSWESKFDTVQGIIGWWWYGQHQIDLISRFKVLMALKISIDVGLLGCNAVWTQPHFSPENRHSMFLRNLPKSPATTGLILLVSVSFFWGGGGALSIVIVFFKNHYVSEGWLFPPPPRWNLHCWIRSKCSGFAKTQWRWIKSEKQMPAIQHHRQTHLEFVFAWADPHKTCAHVDNNVSPNLKMYLLITVITYFVRSSNRISSDA
jgi:hypothetical protein